MKLYQALYNPCTEESCAGTISIHLSKEGAETAIKAHKEQELKDYNKLWEGDMEPPCEFGAFEWWGVGEIEVFP